METNVKEDARLASENPFVPPREQDAETRLQLARATTSRDIQTGLAMTGLVILIVLVLFATT